MQKYYVIKDCKGNIYLIFGADGDGWWEAIDTDGDFCDDPFVDEDDLYNWNREGFTTYDEALENRFEKSNAEILGKMSIKEFVNTYVSE